MGNRGTRDGNQSHIRRLGRLGWYLGGNSQGPVLLHCVCMMMTLIVHSTRRWFFFFSLFLTQDVFGHSDENEQPPRGEKGLRMQRDCSNSLIGTLTVRDMPMRSGTAPPPRPVREGEDHQFMVMTFGGVLRTLSERNNSCQANSSIAIRWILMNQRLTVRWLED